MTPRRAPMLIVLVLALAAVSAARAGGPDHGGDTTTAPDDTLATAAADTMLTLEQRLLLIDEILAAAGDSLRAIGKSQQLVDYELVLRRKRLEREARAAYAEQTGTSTPLFFDCENSPEVGVKADVTRVNYFGHWNNTVKVKGGGSLTNNFNYGYDVFRRQDKTIETRAASVDYSSGSLLPLTLTAQASTNWSEDVTTNSGGSTNINARKLRRAGLMANRTALMTGALSHNLTAGFFYNDQTAVNLQQQNDFSNGEMSGALRSGVPVIEGLNVATRVYGIWRDGDSNLAGFESPSSTTGDSLGAGAYYERRLMQGSFAVTKSNFDKRYLDFRRNSNGLIDTFNLLPGESTVVQELEEKDALNLRWQNTLSVGRAALVSLLQHTTEQQQYRVSGVGSRDRNKDAMKLGFTVPVGADSFAVAYKYEWNWDNQQFRDATSPRGRQNRKVREFSIDWFRDIFANTAFVAHYRTELTQEIAEWVDGIPFNENDRDRLTQEVRLKLDTSWQSGFTVGLLLEYQSIDDISIRRTRSANNNAKSTYTVAPTYRLRLGPRLRFQQVFRMYIQYQDFEFADLPQVNKDDTYNKRGGVGTKLSWEPSDGWRVEIKHDYNQRFNGTRTARDAAGNFFYRRDADQFINRLELGMTWETTDWLKLSTATYRTRDTILRFGTTNLENIRYSGELWIGGIINHTWGQDNPLKLKASIKRYLAYGPNVTETSADYWKADVLLGWSF